MVEYSGNLEGVIKAIADPVRRQILATLKQGSATVGELGEPHDMTFAGAAKHLNILVEANLVIKTKLGRQQLCTLNAKPMQTLQTWLDGYSEFWNDRLDSLEAAVKEFENER